MESQDFMSFNSDELVIDALLAHEQINHDDSEEEKEQIEYFLFNDSHIELSDDESKDPYAQKEQLKKENFQYINELDIPTIRKIIDSLSLNVTLFSRKYKYQTFECKKQQEFNKMQDIVKECSVCGSKIFQKYRVSSTHLLSCNNHFICEMCHVTHFWTQNYQQEIFHNVVSPHFLKSFEFFKSYQCPCCRKHGQTRIIQSRVPTQLDDNVLAIQIYEFFSSHATFTSQTLKFSGQNRRDFYIIIEDLQGQINEDQQVLNRMDNVIQGMACLKQVPNYYMYYEEFTRIYKAIFYVYHMQKKYVPIYAASPYYYPTICAIVYSYLRKLMELYQRITHQVSNNALPLIFLKNMYNSLYSIPLSQLVKEIKIPIEHNYYSFLPNELRLQSSYSLKLHLYTNQLQVARNRSDLNVEQLYGQKLTKDEDMIIERIEFKPYFDQFIFDEIVKHEPIMNGDIFNYMTVMKQFFYYNGIVHLKQEGLIQQAYTYNIMISHKYVLFFFYKPKHKCTGECTIPWELRGQPIEVIYYY